MQNGKPIFTYELREPGTAFATFKVNDDTVEFELTNVSNPLGDLMEGLVTMITTPSHIWGEENTCHVIWYGESSTYNWSITYTENNQCHVLLTESVDFFGDDTKSLLLEFDCNFHELILCFVDELDTFIKHVGLLNYTQTWQKDEFPLTQFLYLKKVLIDNNQWPAATNKEKGILNDEFTLLMA